MCIHKAQQYKPPEGWDTTNRDTSKVGTVNFKLQSNSPCFLLNLTEHAVISVQISAVANVERPDCVFCGYLCWRQKFFEYLQSRYSKLNFPCSICDTVLVLNPGFPFLSVTIIIHSYSLPHRHVKLKSQMLHKIKKKLPPLPPPSHYSLVERCLLALLLV